MRLEQDRHRHRGGIGHGPRRRLALRARRRVGRRRRSRQGRRRGSGRPRSTPAGGKAIALSGNLRDDAFAHDIVRQTANAFGGLDFVWNHVGHPGPAAVEGIDMADFELAIDLNLRTVLVTTEAAIAEMKARGGGALLYTASTSGLVGSGFSPVYSMAKFGVVGFVRALGKAACARQHPGQRGLSRPDRHADAARVRLPPRPAEPDPGQGRADRPAQPAGADEAHRQTRGNRQRSAVPLVGRSLVRDRRGAAGRWRRDGLIPPKIVHRELAVAVGPGVERGEAGAGGQLAEFGNCVFVGILGVDHLARGE